MRISYSFAIAITLSLLLRQSEGFSAVPNHNNVMSNSQKAQITITKPPSEEAGSSGINNKDNNWLSEKLETWFDTSTRLKCPFFRRRTSDLLLKLDDVAQSLSLIPRQSLPLGCRSRTGHKERNLPIEKVLEIIKKDWKTHNSKGYYITGKLTPSIYSDACVFDGPDPDMPVVGLKSYQMVANQLFVREDSTAELLDLYLDSTIGAIKAKWIFNARLRLPWKPRLPEVIGETTYFLNNENLIHLHKEIWGASAMEAFVKTFAPAIGTRLFGSDAKYPPSSLLD